MFKTLNSVSNTCHFIKTLKNTTCFGLNRPFSSVKKLFIKKIADSRKQARKQGGTGTEKTEGRMSMNA
jgi:hypothetical protein